MIIKVLCLVICQIQLPYNLPIVFAGMRCEMWSCGVD